MLVEIGFHDGARQNVGVVGPFHAHSTSLAPKVYPEPFLEPSGHAIHSVILYLSYHGF